MTSYFRFTSALSWEGGGSNMNLSEILGSLKRDKKEKKFWNTARQLNLPERAPRVGGQLFGVRLPNFHFKVYF